MGFWSKFAKFAIPIGAGLATVFTGGAAAPLLGMALGGGAGAAQSALSGGGWKGALKGGLMGGALGGLGGVAGGALKGLGGLGKGLAQTAKYAPSAMKAIGGLQGQGAPPQTQGMSAPQFMMPQRQGGYLNPIGLMADRRTGLAGMGTRQYA